MAARFIPCIFFPSPSITVSVFIQRYEFVLSMGLSFLHDSLDKLKGGGRKAGKRRRDMISERKRGGWSRRGDETSLFAHFNCFPAAGDGMESPSVHFEATSMALECPRGVCLDLNACEDFGGAAPCTCMRATRIAMVSYFQVTLWRGFVRVTSLIGVRCLWEKEPRRKPALFLTNKTFKNVFAPSLSSFSFSRYPYFEIRTGKNSVYDEII